MKRFILDCMTKVGTDKNHANQLADVLLEADYRGHYSHGLNRLSEYSLSYLESDFGTKRDRLIGMYINDIRSGMCSGSGQPAVLKDKAATAWIDGKNLLGPVVGNFSMQLAIKKAKEAGAGWVVAKGESPQGPGYRGMVKMGSFLGSNHYGIAGWYSMQAQKEGLLVCRCLLCDVEVWW